MDPESSFELIQRAQAGDESAVDKLLARYRPRLQRWASGRLPRYARAMADTDDLVQDALIGTFKNFKTFEHRGEWALQAYLRQAVSNRIRDELRRHDARPQHEAIPEQMPTREPSPLEAAVGQQLFSRYEQALDTLDAAEREAVIARLELGCSYQEIATLVDRPSPDAARMFVARILAKLAARMTEQNL
jgi:RNA polymerase sigma factor (sigma-70 family)